MTDSRDNSEPDAGDLLGVVHAFQQGRRESFDALYGLLWPAVRRRAARMGLPGDECDEIAQKVLVRVYLYVGRARFERVEQVWAWVYAITTREVYKCWRRKHPELVSPEVLELAANDAAAPPADPLVAMASAEVIRDIGGCIDQLDPAERMHLLGVLAGGLTFREAARAHGLTLGQFKHRYEKALDKVRRCMRAKGHVPN